MCGDASNMSMGPKWNIGTHISTLTWGRRCPSKRWGPGRGPGTEAPLWTGIRAGYEMDSQIEDTEASLRWKSLPVVVDHQSSLEGFVRQSPLTWMAWVRDPVIYLTSSSFLANQTCEYNSCSYFASLQGIQSTGIPVYRESSLRSPGNPDC